MRIGHWQLESKCGDFEGNLARAVLGLEKAHKDRVEVLSFPECYLTGYQDTEVLHGVHNIEFAVRAGKDHHADSRTHRYCVSN